MRRFAMLAMLLPALVACTPQQDQPEPAPSSEAPAPTVETVTIWLSTNNPSDCAEVAPVERAVGGRPTLSTGIQQLLAGPTAEERQQNLGAFFSQATRDFLISAERTGEVAEVDFRDLRSVIPNASSSCGSAALLAQLDGTARQFGASRTVYSINGDVDTFYHWLQMPAPNR